MNKFLYLAAIAPMVLLTACNDTAEQIAETKTPSASVYLTDQDGNIVSQIDGEFGTYNLHISGVDAWVIKSDQDFLYPTQTQGYGDAIVPIQAGTCWGYERNATLTVHTLDLDETTTRATSDGVTTTLIGVSQAPAVAATQIIRYGSNIGVGYSYNPARASDPLLAVGQPIFDIMELYNDGVMKDDFQYEQIETYYVADSEAKLHEKMDISGGLSFKFGSVSAAGSGAYVNNYDKDESSWHCLMQNRTKLYQRDFNYLDEMTSENPHFSVGFKAYRDKLEEELKAAKSTSEISDAVLNFLDHFGPFFIYRAQLGVQLDYTGSIVKSSEVDEKSIKAAIKIKWEKEVVKKKKSDDSTDDKKSDDSADNKKEETNKVPAAFFAEYGEKDGIDIEGQGEYEKKLNNMANNTSARLDIKGGTNNISIIANGGTLSPEEFSAWQRNVNAYNAVVVGFVVAPIYICFDMKSLSYKYLKQYDNQGGKIE